MRSDPMRAQVLERDAPPVPIREELLGRRHRLQRTIERVGPARDLVRLAHEVDHALERLERQPVPICVICDEHMECEPRRHPMGRYCLCDLDENQWQALQHDLDLAWSIQAGLLPAQDLATAGWLSHYRYLPAGAVSGDLLELVATRGSLQFLLGDVAGKGISASLVMAQACAIYRSLADAGTPLRELARRLNAELASRTVTSRYATLVIGEAHSDGRVELVNAGHLPPLVLRRGGTTRVDSTGLPAGLFADAEYGHHELCLERGESLFLIQRWTRRGKSDRIRRRRSRCRRDRAPSLQRLRAQPNRAGGKRDPGRGRRNSRKRIRRPDATGAAQR